MLSAFNRPTVFLFIIDNLYIYMINTYHLMCALSYFINSTPTKYNSAYVNSNILINIDRDWYFLYVLLPIEYCLDNYVNTLMKTLNLLNYLRLTAAA